MKKKFIYILITVLCFFSFNIGVKADYTHICEYKGESKSGSRTCTNDINLYYDSSNTNKPYSVSVYQSCDSKSSNSRTDGDDTTYDVGRYKLNSKLYGLSTGAGVNVYSNFSGTAHSSCPKNVYYDKGDPGTFICFYTSYSEQKDCEDQMKKVNTNPSQYLKNTVGTLSGQKVSLNSSGNKGFSCDAAMGVKIKNAKPNTATEAICYARFEYDGTNLNIYSSSVNPSSDSSKLKKIGVNDTYFSCGTYEVQGVHDTTYDGEKKMWLTNGNAGNTNAGVQVTSRSAFNQKFIDEYNKYGDCDSLFNSMSYSSEGDAEGKAVNNYYLLFKDAADDCVANGCKNVETSDLHGLQDWNYNWANWYDNDSTYDSCQDLIGSKMIEIINDILLYVRVLIPILLIALGVADFVKAMISPDDSAMKKAQNKFLKRLIIAAVIFLIPSLVNLLFNLVNGVWAHINNSACNIWN